MRSPSEIRSTLHKYNVNYLKKIEEFYINDLTNEIGTMNFKLKNKFNLVYNNETFHLKDSVLYLKKNKNIIIII